MYHKSQNSMPSSNPLKKRHNSLPKKSYRLKTFVQSKNSQKFRFAVTFCDNNRFRNNILQLFNLFAITIKICVY
jgi:hypothetical protein